MREPECCEGRRALSARRASRRVGKKLGTDSRASAAAYCLIRQFANGAKVSPQFFIRRNRAQLSRLSLGYYFIVLVQIFYRVQVFLQCR